MKQLCVLDEICLSVNDKKTLMHFIVSLLNTGLGFHSSFQSSLVFCFFALDSILLKPAMVQKLPVHMGFLNRPR